MEIKESRDNTYKPNEVVIEGGKGVGKVTKPGLDQPVGNFAINHIPREMITKEVLDVCNEADFYGIIKVTVSVPSGEEIAEKTTEAIKNILCSLYFCFILSLHLNVQKL